MIKNDHFDAENALTYKQLVLVMKEWVIFLMSKWRIIILVSLLGGGIGFTYAYMQRTVYTASLSFALEDEKSGGGLSGALGLASQFGIDLGTSAGGAFSGANLIELMKSRSLIEKTLLSPVNNNESVSLADFYIEFTGKRKAWEENSDLRGIRFLPNPDRTKFSLKQDSILGLMYQSIVNSHLNVFQKDKKISIITIEIKTENEAFSKVFVEILAKEVSDFYIETRSKKARMNVNILEAQSDSVRRELNAAISGVAYANDNTYNLNPAFNIKRVPSSTKQVDVQANTAILTELVKNLELARVALRKETPLIQIIDKPILPLKKEKQSKRTAVMIGGVLAGLMTTLLLIARRWWKMIMG